MENFSQRLFSTLKKLKNNLIIQSESWEDILDSLESVPGLVSEIAQLRSFVQSSQVQKAHHLSQVLRDEFPTERSLDDPAKLSDALQMVRLFALSPEKSTQKNRYP